MSECVVADHDPDEVERGLPNMDRRYHFAGFVLSPASRLLVLAGRPVPLVSRYLDLLVLLVAMRRRVVTRQEILDEVWSDVVVSDGALTQAIRTLRRALGDDDPKNPVFIRTVPRHGYQFICPAVDETNDDQPLPLASETTDEPCGEPTAGTDPYEEAIGRLLASDPKGEEENGRREAALRLHELGIDEALRRLDRRPGHAAARALLREVRWDIPDAAPVPFLGHPGVIRATVALIRLRLQAALRLVEQRWAGGACGGALAGLLAGLGGAGTLLAGPGTAAGPGIFVTLAVVGVALGSTGAAGVGAGLAAAEAVFRAARGPALVLGGAAGGWAVGMIAHHLIRFTLEGLVGGDLSAVAGGWEGLVLGAAAGFGYGLTTHPPQGGMATPRGAARLRAAVITGLACKAAAVLLVHTGSLLAAQSLDLLAQGFPGSQVGLAPVVRLLGGAPRPLVTTAIAGCEGFLFGLGLILGLTRRPVLREQRGGRDDSGGDALANSA